MRALLEQGAEVIAADTALSGIDPRAMGVAMDILSAGPDAYDRLGRPDACLHLAWRNGFVHDATTHMEDLSGHVRFLRLLAEGGLPQLAVMGTMHEVGYYVGAVQADTPCNPRSAYGIAKDALRRHTLLSASRQDTRVQWLRAFYIYGDDAGGSSIFAKLLQAAADGRRTFPFTSGKNRYDFIHVQALGRQLAACVLQEEETGIINCCSGRPVSLGEQVEAFIREQGLGIQLEYGAYPDRPYDSPAIWGDAARIRAIMKGRD